MILILGTAGGTNEDYSRFNLDSTSVEKRPI